MLSSQFTWKHVLACLGFAAAATLLTLITWPWSQNFPFVIVLAAVVASAWYSTPASALLTSAFCTLGLGSIYYGHSAQGSADLLRENLLRLVLFFLTGCLTSYLVYECRRAIGAVDRVQTTMAQLGEALVTTDAWGHVRFLNDHARALTGWNAAEAAGKPLKQVLAMHDSQSREPLADLFQKVAEKRAVIDLPAGAMLQTMAGAILAVEGRAAPVMEGDLLEGIAVTFRDVSARRRQEGLERRQEVDALRARCQELEDQLQRLTLAAQKTEAGLHEQLADLEERALAEQQQREQKEKSWSQKLKEIQGQLEAKAAALTQAEKRLESALNSRDAEWQKRLDAESKAHREEADELLRLAEEEQEQALATERAARQSAEEALAQAQAELSALRDQPKSSADQEAKHEELVYKLSELTARCLGLEESLRRARVQIETLSEEKRRGSEQQDSASARTQQLEEALKAAQQQTEILVAEKRQACQLQAAAEEKLHQVEEDLDRQLAEARRMSGQEQSHREQLLEERAEAVKSEGQADRARLEERIRELEHASGTLHGDYDGRIAALESHWRLECQSIRDQLQAGQQNEVRLRQEKEELQRLLEDHATLIGNGQTGGMHFQFLQSSAYPIRDDWLGFN